MSEWRKIRLNDLVEEIIDRRGVTPLKLGSNFTTSGYRVISAKLVKNNRIDLSSDVARYVDRSTYLKWMKTPLKSDDVILTSEAPIGETAYLREDAEWCLGQRLFCIRTKKEIMNGRFLFYCLQYENTRHELLSRATGTTAQGISQESLRQALIPIPPLPEQKAIAHILGSLDDKIELNRRMNETLEAMARAIFKDWFVDFGPTRAKIEGRAPYLPEPIWSLFPDAIDPQSGLPQGWEIAPFESIVSVKDGTHDSPKMSDFGYPLITSKHLKNGYIDFDSAYLISEKDFLEVNKRSKVDRLDILITMIGTVGNLFFVDYKSIDFAIKNVGLFKTSEKPHLAEYLYLYLGSSNITNYLASRQSGTTQSYLTLKALRTIPVVLPKVELVEAFKTKISSIFERITVNRDESRTLAKLRDRLLPKLMSGQIRVKDAEKLVEEVL